MKRRVPILELLIYIGAHQPIDTPAIAKAFDADASSMCCRLSPYRLDGTLSSTFNLRASNAGRKPRVWRTGPIFALTVQSMKNKRRAAISVSVKPVLSGVIAGPVYWRGTRWGVDW